MNLLQTLFGSKTNPSAADNLDVQDLPDLDVTLPDAPMISPDRPKPTARPTSTAPEAEAIETAGIPSVNHRRGHSKMVTLGGFVAILGVGAVVFVSANTGKASKPRTTPEAARISNRLPPLELIPVAQAAPATPSARYVVPAILQSEPGDVAPIELRERAVNERAAPGQDSDASQTHGKPATEDWVTRKMSGGLLVASKDTSGSVSAPGETSAATRGSGSTRSPLALSLEPTLTTGVSASMLPDQNYLISKGRSFDCVLQTALDSTLPGLTTCIVDRDVQSDNGNVTLVDRGSQAVGEYQGGLKQGQVRMGVLWTRVTTPRGVAVALDSPGTDALGRTGLEGWVDTHFAERFGAAMLMSFLQDSVTALLSRQQPATGSIIVGNTAATAGEKIVEKILDSTVNIAPTLVKNHGDHIQIMVARDLDFSSVYALRVNRR